MSPTSIRTTHLNSRTYYTTNQPPTKKTKTNSALAATMSSPQEWWESKQAAERGVILFLSILGFILLYVPIWVMCTAEMIKQVAPKTKESVLLFIWCLFSIIIGATWPVWLALGFVIGSIGCMVQFFCCTPGRTCCGMDCANCCAGACDPPPKKKKAGDEEMALQEGVNQSLKAGSQGPVTEAPVTQPPPAYSK